jgi:peptide/nickel transport system ATP-binding protein
MNTNASNAARPLLEVDNLTVDFLSAGGAFRATSGVSFHVNAGETLAILGESGSGKSVSSSAIMGLIDTPPGKIQTGSIRYKGKELARMNDEERRQFNGRKLAMIFQDPLSHLNPVYTVGWQLS